MHIEVEQRMQHETMIPVGGARTAAGRLASRWIPFALCLAISGASGLATSTASAQEATRIEVRTEAGSRPRLRFGLSGVGGGFVGSVEGGAIGIAPRIGVQLNDVVALYLQGHGLLGHFNPVVGDGWVGGFAFHEAMFELTFANRFQFGAGPSIDFVWGCREDNGRTGCGRGNARFGGDFRVAVILGDDANRDGPGRRTGVVLSIDAHPTWLDPGFGTMLLFGVGGEMY